MRDDVMQLAGDVRALAARGVFSERVRERFAGRRPRPRLAPCPHRDPGRRGGRRAPREQHFSHAAVAGQRQHAERHRQPDGHGLREGEAASVRPAEFLQAAEPIASDQPVPIPAADRLAPPAPGPAAGQAAPRRR